MNRLTKVAAGLGGLAIYFFFLSAVHAQVEGNDTTGGNDGMQDARLARELDVSIARVWSGGFWEEGTRRGYFRLVVTGRGYEHVANQLFIQWIEQGDRETGPRLVAQRPLTRVNDPAVFVFDLPRCTLRPQCTSLELDVRHTYTYEEQKLLIRLLGLGAYEVSRLE